MTARPAQRDADARALQRIRSRRLIVVAPEVHRADALADALRAGGAAVVALGELTGDLDAAYALDADAILAVDGGEPLRACEPIIDALQRHPRVRWATVILAASAPLRSDATRGAALTVIANQVAAATAAVVELAVRAKGKLPHATRLEEFGLNRMLRVLADTQRALRLTLSGAFGRAVVELAEGRVLAVRADLVGQQPALADVHALAALLPLSEAQVAIEAGGPASGRSWNMPVTTALARAAAIAVEAMPALRPQPELDPEPPPAAPGAAESEREPVSMLPTRPQIELAEALAAAELDAVLEVSSEPPGDTWIPPADAQTSGRRQRSELDLAITQEFAVPEAAPAGASAPDTTTPDAAAAPPAEASAPRARGRSRRGLLIGAGLIGSLALAFAAVVRFDPQVLGAWLNARAAAGAPQPMAALQAPRTPPAQALGPIAAAAPPASLATVAESPDDGAEPAQAEVEAENATEAAAPQAPAPGRAQLRRAQALVKRARREHRAGRVVQAELLYREALARVPSEAQAIAGLARIELARKNGDEAARWAEQLVKLEPDHEGYQLLLGDAYALRGSQVEAEQAWQTAKRLGSRTARKRLIGSP